MAGTLILILILKAVSRLLHALHAPLSVSARSISLLE
jgi:hypothetical protein